MFLKFSNYYIIIFNADCAAIIRPKPLGQTQVCMLRAGSSFSGLFVGSVLNVLEVLCEWLKTSLQCLLHFLGVKGDS